MDGIKDAGMWLDYAENAMAENDQAHAIWFGNHAKSRVNQLSDDYDYIIREIGLVDKVKSGDPIAEALHSHLKYQINDVIDRVNRM